MKRDGATQSQDSAGPKRNRRVRNFARSGPRIPLPIHHTHPQDRTPRTGECGDTGISRLRSLRGSLTRKDFRGLLEVQGETGGAHRVRQNDRETSRTRLHEKRRRQVHHPTKKDRIFISFSLLRFRNRDRASSLWRDSSTRTFATGATGKTK